MASVWDCGHGLVCERGSLELRGRLEKRGHALILRSKQIEVITMDMSRMLHTPYWGHILLFLRVKEVVRSCSTLSKQHQAYLRDPYYLRTWKIILSYDFGSLLNNVNLRILPQSKNSSSGAMDFVKSLFVNYKLLKFRTHPLARKYETNPFVWCQCLFVHGSFGGFIHWGTQFAAKLNIRIEDLCLMAKYPWIVKRDCVEGALHLFSMCLIAHAQFKDDTEQNLMYLNKVGHFFDGKGIMGVDDCLHPIVFACHEFKFAILSILLKFVTRAENASNVQYDENGSIFKSISQQLPVEIRQSPSSLMIVFFVSLLMYCFAQDLTTNQICNRLFDSGGGVQFLNTLRKMIATFSIQQCVWKDILHDSMFQSDCSFLLISTLYSKDN